jgi:hypothetical protein
MKRFLMSVALSATLLTSLASANPAEKGEYRPERSSTYHERHGKPFSGGYYYAGREHKHWKSCYFDKRYGCYAYLCPSTKVYYYWCKPDDCYYPISYCPHSTYDFGAGRVCSESPVKQPTHPPIWGGNPPRPTSPPKWGGNPPRPTDPPKWGGNPPRGGGHGPVIPPSQPRPTGNLGGPYHVGNIGPITVVTGKQPVGTNPTPRPAPVTGPTSGNPTRKPQSVAHAGSSVRHK